MPSRQQQPDRLQLAEGLSVRLARAPSPDRSDMNSVIEPGDAAAGETAGRVRLGRRLRQPQDTPLGCREKAAADLERAAAGIGGQQSWLYEHSAASWNKRADALEQQAAALDARRQGLR